MNEPQAGDRPLRTSGAHLVLSSGRTLIASSDGASVVAVNESAAALFELCDGVTTVEEMAAAVCDASSIPLEQARRDVGHTLGELGRAGLIIIDRDGRADG